MLRAWSSSPTRFREDANAEDDLRLGGYADAWFVELAQNAADAARAAGVEGRMRVGLSGGELRVANTGAPLDAAGVASLAALRASAKRDAPAATGRFGVGFAAVLALTDEPRLVSRDGGVRFSASATAAEVDALPGPAAERDRRGGRVPVLRLVWPAGDDEPPVPDGYATEVRLPLTDPDRGPELLDRARADASDLLLALPGLVAIEVDGERIAREDGPGGVRIGSRRWRTVARPVPADPEPDGERAAAELVWAVPVDDDGRPAPLDPDTGAVLHAPTATAEALSLPARLIAPFPLDPDRRRIRAGRRTDELVAEAAAGYAALVLACVPADRARLVPVPAFPRSPLDGALRDAVAATLATTRWLPGAAGEDLAPRHAEWLDLPGADGLPELLAPADPAFARLVATGPAPPPGLDVARVGGAELADRLLGVTAPPPRWARLYALLDAPARSVPGLADELRALPVPLADGRLARGPASVLLPPERPDPAVTAVAGLGLTGLHVAAADAVHPLLRRLGAGTADRDALRAHPALHDAVERSPDDADAGLDTEPLARAVLALLDRGEPAGWTLGLVLGDDEDEPACADELVLPDAAIRPLLAPDAPVGVLGARWADVDRDALVATGVLDGFAVTDLAGLDADDWVDEHPDAPAVAVRGLDLVDPQAWPDALRLLATDRDVRDAVLAPDGHAGWWLARHVRLGGRPPSSWRLGSATGLAGLYDPVDVPDGVDEVLLAAIGVRDRLRVEDAVDAADLLERLGDERRAPTPDTVTSAHRALTDAVADGRVAVDDVDPPSRVRTVTGTVVDADAAVVLDVPWALPALDGHGVLAGGDPVVLADVLDTALASETVVGAPVDPDAGTARPWSELTEVVVACHTFGLPIPDGEVVLHDELTIEVTAPRRRRITCATWPGTDGRWHASDPVRALLAEVLRAAGGPIDRAVAGERVLGSARDPVRADATPSGGGAVGAHVSDGAARYR